MLHTPTVDELRALVREDSHPILSLQVEGPRTRGFPDLDALPVRFRAAHERCERWLREHGHDAEPFLAGLREAQPGLDALPRGPWTYLAFASERGTRAFVAHRSRPDAVCAGDVPVLAAALLAAGHDRGFRVLALSTKRVALFEGDRDELRELQGTGVPESLEAALGSELSKKEELQQHGYRGRAGSTIYHGQGGASDERETDLVRFHRRIARAVEGHWAGREDPLVLVADEAHQGRLRAVASLHGLLEQGVHQNPAALRAPELHDAVWPVVRHEVERRRAERFERLGHARGAGKVVEGLVAAGEHAAEGRVARLWIEPTLPGGDGARADEHGVLPTRAEDRVLVDVLRHGGEVELLEARSAGETGPFAELRG